MGPLHKLPVYCTDWYRLELHLQLCYRDIVVALVETTHILVDLIHANSSL